MEYLEKLKILLNPNNKGTDQLAHMHSFISAIVIHYQENIIVKIAISIKNQYSR